ncbi:gpW family head-tail joining protein [Burkholderia vietnamiensis]|uniref:gpW family head-tail joining protein n=1 Tax=Burkholderia vietnamiensis TaxID=60552 RepID=UPI0015948540|nr:gpW family head-tail joining protein [Burkholderia vietnamiensis]
MATTDLCSPLYGMTDAQLQAALAAAQEAYLDLRSGNKAVTVSYAQGDGSRSVTFQSTNVAAVRMFIAELQAALNPGVRICRRRRMVPLF